MRTVSGRAPQSGDARDRRLLPARVLRCLPVGDVEQHGFQACGAQGIAVFVAPHPQHVKAAPDLERSASNSGFALVSTSGRASRGGKRGSAHSMERSTQLAEPSCAEKILLCIELLQGKWTVHILCAMRARSVRLSELRREIPFASKKSLTASLRYLEAARVIVRRDMSSSILHVEYELADPMREPLGTLFDLLAEWGEAYSKQDSAPIEHPESSKI